MLPYLIFIILRVRSIIPVLQMWKMRYIVTIKTAEARTGLGSSPSSAINQL